MNGKRPKSSDGGRRFVTARSADTNRVIGVNGGADPATESVGSGDTFLWRRLTFGRLLLFAFTAYESRMIESYRAAGFRNVRQVHFNVLRHIDIPKGTRISDLAVRAGITNSAMGQLVVECTRIGLVTLASDPADGRAKVVRLAKRGRDLMAQTRRSGQRIEADMATLIGVENFKALRSALARPAACNAASERAIPVPGGPMGKSLPKQSRSTPNVLIACSISGVPFQIDGAVSNQMRLRSDR